MRISSEISPQSWHDLFYEKEKKKRRGFWLTLTSVLAAKLSSWSSFIKAEGELVLFFSATCCT